jgi:hypothetical protein
MFGKEPAVILGAIQSILALGLSFGLHLEPTQIGAIMAAAAAILALVVRQQVIPVKNQTVGQATAPQQ